MSNRRKPRRHDHRRPREPRPHPDGIALASACDACAHLIGGAEHLGPDRHMAIIHAHHVPELEAAGWILITHPHEPPDICCEHYYEANREDG